MVETTGNFIGMKARLKIRKKLPQYTNEQQKKLKNIIERRRAAIIADKAERHYLYLYHIITEKSLDTDRRDQFKVLVQQFGDIAVQEAVEYILMKNSAPWPVEAFFSYLLKMLQGRRDEEGVTLDEDSVEYTARREKTINKLHQARQWRYKNG